MKKVFKNKIINIDNSLNINNFLFEYIISWENKNIKTIFIGDLLKDKKNISMLEMANHKSAIYSNVYSPKDELEIFINLFENAIKNNEKIHIIGITLKEELNIIEEYYEELGFKRDYINCFDVDYKIPLITVSVKIENIMWKGSDYKRMGKEIFFNPPIRESGQVKAMFKGINKGLIANIYFERLNAHHVTFLQKCITEEQILSIPLAKLLKYNLESIGFKGINKDLIITY